MDNPETTMRTLKSMALMLAVGVTVAIMTLSCSTSLAQDATAPLEAHPIASIEAVSRQPDHRPVVGLALGGGGLRGLAHIGVLQALEEQGIRPDVVVGTSAGALVGAVYASGKTPRQIRDLAQQVKIGSFMDFTLSRGGIMRGDNIARWVDEATGHAPVETFPIRYAAVATDLERGTPVLLERGRAGDAVRASASVPGVQVPVAYADGHLVDGGVSSLVPVRAARALGADIVIAVDIYCHGQQTVGLNAAAVLRRTMHAQSCLLAAPEVAEANIRVFPSVVVPGLSDKDQQRQAIQVGYEAARSVLANADLSDLRRAGGGKPRASR